MKIGELIGWLYVCRDRDLRAGFNDLPTTEGRESDGGVGGADKREGGWAGKRWEGTVG